jgi:hypothetical protein
MALEVLAMYLGGIGPWFALRGVPLTLMIACFMRWWSSFAPMAPLILALWLVGIGIGFALGWLAALSGIFRIFPGSIGLFHNLPFWQLAHMPPL